MALKVRLPTILRPYARGQSTVEAKGSTMREVIADLEDRYPGLGSQLLADDGNLHPFVNVFLGDEDIRYLDGLATAVGAGTELSIIPAVAGG